MGCRLSSSARHEPQVRGQRRSTQGGFTSKTGFGDVANFVPVSLDIRSDRYSTGPPGELIQTNGQPACPEDGVLHADVSRRDSVVLCFKPSCITANSRAASPWFTIPSRSHMLSNFEWRFLWDVREYDMLRCSLYLECRRTPLKQQKFCVDVCHNFELRGAEICFSFALITLEEVMTEKQRRRIISSRSSPKLQLQNVQKTHKNWSQPITSFTRLLKKLFPAQNLPSKVLHKFGEHGTSSLVKTQVASFRLKVYFKMQKQPIQCQGSVRSSEQRYLSS